MAAKMAAKFAIFAPMGRIYPCLGSLDEAQQA